MKVERKEWKTPKLVNHGEVSRITAKYCKSTGSGDVEITQVQLNDWVSCTCPTPGC